VISRLLGQQPGARALDLGCGGGLYARELAARGASVVGLDPHGESLAQARDRLGGMSICWVRADARDLPFRDDAFDAITSVEVLTHLSPEVREQTMFEVARTVRSGAQLFLTLHNRSRLTLSRWLRLRARLPVYQTSNLDVWPTTPGEALALAARCGFVATARVHYLNYYPRFSDSFARRHPWLARFIVLAEGAFARTWIVRRCAITFLLRLRAGGAK